MASVEFHIGIGIGGDPFSSGTLDTVDDLGFDEGEWESLDEGAKDMVVYEWSQDWVDTWYEEF